MANPLHLTRELNILARLEKQRAHSNSPEMAEAVESAISESDNVIRIMSTAQPTYPAHTFNDYAENLYNQLKKI